MPSSSAPPNPDDLSTLRVAIIAGTLGQGGAERQLYYMLRALRGAGCDVRVLSLTRGEVWEERIRALGVPVVWVGQSSGRLARLRQIIAELRRERPHIVQSAHFFTNPYVAVAARAVGAREIGAIRSNAFSESRVHGRLIGLLGLRLPRTLAVNSLVGQRNAVALGVPENRLYYLPNVLDTTHFTPAANEKHDAFQLVAVGRLGPEKRFDRFLQVVSRLRASGPVSATLVGDGPLRGDLESLAAELKLNDVLEFVGAVADPLPHLRRADAAFLCSTYEGTPNVLLEAQACGLPVITTDVGGVADIVRDSETGFLVSSAGEEEQILSGLTAAAQLLRDEPSRRLTMSLAARRFIEERFNSSLLTEYMSALYKHTLRR